MASLLDQWVPSSPLEAVSTGLLVLFALSLAAAGWVWWDARMRFPRGPEEGWAWVWAVGTLFALPIFLPIYLIGARPVGHVTRCPSCGRGTLSHRAACIHCGQPITFDAFPAWWGLGEVVGVATALTVSLRAIAQAAGLNELRPLTALTIIGVAQNVLFVLLVAYVVRQRYHQPLDAVGLRAERWPLWSAVGVLVGAVTIPLSAVAERVAILVIGVFVGIPRAEALAATEDASNILAGILQTQLTGPELAWVFVLLCVLVPVGEEVFFRGFIYGTLRRWSRVWAVVLSSVLFAAVHLQVVHFLPILLLGVVLALLYERTGSLAGSIAVHGINNLVALLASLYHWNI